MPDTPQDMLSSPDSIAQPVCVFLSVSLKALTALPPQMAFRLTFCFGRAGLLPPGSAVGHPAAKLLAVPASPDPGHSRSASTAASAAAAPRLTKRARTAEDPRARPASATTRGTAAAGDPRASRASASTGGKLGTRGRKPSAACESVITACNPSSGSPGLLRPPQGGDGSGAAQQEGLGARPSTAPEMHALPRPSVAPEMHALSRALYPKPEPSGWRRRAHSASSSAGLRDPAASRAGSPIRYPNPTHGTAGSIRTVERAAADARRRTLAAMLLAAFPPGLAPLAARFLGDAASKDLAGAQAGRPCAGGIIHALHFGKDLDGSGPKRRQTAGSALGRLAGGHGAVRPVAHSANCELATCVAPGALFGSMRSPLCAQGPPTGKPRTEDSRSRRGMDAARPSCSEPNAPSSSGACGSVQGALTMGFSAAECRSAVLLWELRTAQRVASLGLQTSHELQAARMPRARGFVRL